MSEFRVVGNAAERIGDVLFWERLSGMPFSESEDLLLRTKAGLLRDHAAFSTEARKGGYTDARCIEIQNTVTEINGELSRLRKIEDFANLRTAIVDLWGQDALGEALEWIEMKKGRGLTFLVHGKPIETPPTTPAAAG